MEWQEVNEDQEGCCITTTTPSCRSEGVVLRSLTYFNRDSRRITTATPSRLQMRGGWIFFTLRSAAASPPPLTRQHERRVLVFLFCFFHSGQSPHHIYHPISFANARLGWFILQDSRHVPPRWHHPLLLTNARFIDDPVHDWQLYYIGMYVFLFIYYIIDY
jgi:hypothetical protein